MQHPNDLQLEDIDMIDSKRMRRRDSTKSEIQVAESDPFAHLDMIRTPSGSVKDHLESVAETSESTVGEQPQGPLKHLPQNLDVIFEEEDQSYDENDLVDEEGQFIIFTSPEEGD